MWKVGIVASVTEGSWGFNITTENGRPLSRSAVRRGPTPPPRTLKPLLIKR
jgi:hypothetical protein